MPGTPTTLAARANVGGTGGELCRFCQSRDAVALARPPSGAGIVSKPLNRVTGVRSRPVKDNQLEILRLRQG